MSGRTGMRFPIHLGPLLCRPARRHRHVENDPHPVRDRHAVKAHLIAEGEIPQHARTLASSDRSESCGGRDREQSDSASLDHPVAHQRRNRAHDAFRMGQPQILSGHVAHHTAVDFVVARGAALGAECQIVGLDRCAAISCKAIMGQYCGFTAPVTAWQADLARLSSGVFSEMHDHRHARWLITQTTPSITAHPVTAITATAEIICTLVGQYIYDPLF